MTVVYISYRAPRLIWETVFYDEVIHGCFLKGCNECHWFVPGTVQN